MTLEFWYWPVTAFLGGVLLVNFLWRKRQRRILKSLNKLIATEEEAGHSSVFRNPGDMEQALKALFEARKLEMEKLRRMESYRRDYIGNVAHELKTPIFTIQGYLDSLMDELGEVTPDLELARNYLNKAERNTERLSQIIGDLDTITKYESGALRLEFEDFDMNLLVNVVIESLEIQAAEKQIHITNNTLTGNYWVSADRHRIQQVMTNLVLNSIRYGKPGGHTRIRLSSTGNRIITEVADNGIGISTEHLSRIFERFYRVESSRSRDSGGSGLGLSICKHIVEAHGDSIHVISTEGAGSVFSFGLNAAVK